MKLPKLSRQVAAKSRGLCWYCGDDTRKTRATTDHVVPLSKGGFSLPDNLVLACAPCNTKKAALSVEEFRALVQRENTSPVVFFGECNGKGYQDSLSHASFQRLHSHPASEREALRLQLRREFDEAVAAVYAS